MKHQFPPHASHITALEGTLPSRGRWSALSFSVLLRVSYASASPSRWEEGTAARFLWILPQGLCSVVLLQPAPKATPRWNANPSKLVLCFIYFIHKSSLIRPTLKHCSTLISWENLLKVGKMTSAAKEKDVTGKDEFHLAFIFRGWCPLKHGELVFRIKHSSKRRV